MPVSKNKEFKFGIIHFQAIIALVLYNVLSKLIFIKFLLFKNIYLSFVGPYLFGICASAFLLYLFSHEKFFPWVYEIEKREDKQEKKWIHKYIHHGKVATCLIIGTIGGPVFEALSLRILLHNKSFVYKMTIVCIANIFSTIFTISIAKGLIKLI